MKLTKYKPTLRACLVYLFILTFVLTSVTFSSYITSSTSNDRARTAAISEIDVIGDDEGTLDFDRIIIPGVDIENKANVVFDKSEVDTFVYIQIVLSSDWEHKSDNAFVIKHEDEELLSFEVNSNWKFLKNEDDNTFVFYSKVLSNTNINEEIISENKIHISEYVTEDIINSLDNTFIKFKATAIQTIDGLTALDVWNSN